MDAFGPMTPGDEILVPLAVWPPGDQRLREEGVAFIPLVQGADDPLVLAPHFAELRVIAVEFADFNDGRGYSHAVTLRQRGFGGQLRAVGDVLRDQLFYLLRCGFDAFEPRADRSTAEFVTGYHDFRVTYQASAMEPPLFRRRQEALAALEAQS